MSQRGFSLVEMIIVMAIMGILLSIATLNWSGMQRKTAIETQTKTMYTNLMRIRLEALYAKRSRSIKIVGNQFSIYSSNVTSVMPISQISLSLPIVWNSGNTVTFDSSGLTTTDKSICVDPANDLTVDNPGAVDSIVISTARVNMGKRQSGGNCATGTIDQK